MRGVHIKSFIPILAVLGMLGGMLSSARAQETILVEWGSTWSYETNELTYSESWRDLGYDASAWPTALAPQGFAAGEATPLGAIGTVGTALPSRGENTVMFRQEFTFTGDPNAVSLVISNIADDGAIIFVNGTKVATAGNFPDDPDNGGTGITFASQTDDRGNDVGTTRIDAFSVGAGGVLMNGNNVVAVEVHQEGANSSDIVHATALSVVTAFGPTFTEEPQDATISQGESVTLTASATGSPTPTYQWFFDADGPGGAPALAISGETGTSYTISDAQPSSDSGFYFVRATGALGSVDSRLALVTVNPDSTPPVLISAVGLDDLITIVLTVDEPLETDPLLSGAEDPFSYTLYSKDGLETLFFATAVVSNAPNGAIQVVLELIDPRDATKQYELEVFPGIVSDLYGNYIDSPGNLIDMVTLFQQELVGFHSVWEYDQSGVDPGDWLASDAPAFPNSGAGLLGQETTGGSVALIMTDLTSPGEGSGTFSYYFRTRFFVADVSIIQSLTMNYYVDDAAVIYINGVEVYRTDYEGQVIPGNPGDPIPFGTQPPGAVSNAELVEGASIPVSALVDGENIISVYNGQGGGNSSDVVWGCELLATGIVVVGEPPEILIAPVGGNADEYDTFSLTVVATPPPLDYQWFKDGVEVTGATSATLTLSPAVPSQSGMYSVRVSNVTGTTNSPAVQVIVAPDMDAPTVASVVADASQTSIDVTFSEPVSDVTATNTANYAIVERDTSAPLNILSATISGNVVTLTTDPKEPTSNYEISISGVQDLAETPNTIAPVTVGVTLTVQIFTTGHIWSYDEQNIDLGTEWRAPGYDDSSWPSGPSILGYEANLTIATPWQQTFPGNPETTITYYARTHFNYDGDPAEASLTANLRFDDGFILYLNGVEVARQGFTGDAFHTNFFTSHESDQINTFDISNANLLSGDNVLAVEVHQTSLGSSDAVWDMELLNIVDEVVPPTGCPEIEVSVSPTDGNADEGDEVIFTANILGGARPITFQWFNQSGDLAGETGSTLTISGASPGDNGNYGVRASNSENATNCTQTANAPVALTVAPDLTAPTLVACVANADGTSITLVFDKAMDSATAENPANYSVSGGVTVLSATLSADGTTVVLTTTARPPGSNYTVTVSDVEDATFTGNVIDPNPTVCELPIELAGAAAVWSYDESNIDPGATWNTAGFDDSAWPTGTGIFGFEANLTITTPWDSAAGTTNFYLRTTFSGAAAVAGNQLVLRALYDDGFVAYLNGVEIARAGLDPADDPVEHGDLAASHEATAYEFFVLDPAQLLPGDNLLAVRIHQQNATSSDAVWDGQIYSRIAPCNADDPTISYDSVTGQVTITWDDSAGAELHSSSTADGTYTNTGESSPYTFTPTVGATLFFQVACP